MGTGTGGTSRTGGIGQTIVTVTGGSSIVTGTRGSGVVTGPGMTQTGVGGGRGGGILPGGTRGGGTPPKGTRRGGAISGGTGEGTMFLSPAPAPYNPFVTKLEAWQKKKHMTNNYNKLK